MMGDLGSSTPMGGSILLEGPTQPARDTDKAQPARNTDKAGVTLEDLVNRAAPGGLRAH